MSLVARVLPVVRFEGPVLFACLREFVSLFDEEFDLFTRIPAIVHKANWVCARTQTVACHAPS